MSDLDYNAKHHGDGGEQEHWDEVADFQIAAEVAMDSSKPRVEWMGNPPVARCSEHGPKMVLNSACLTCQEARKEMGSLVRRITDTARLDKLERLTHECGHGLTPSFMICVDGSIDVGYFIGGDEPQPPAHYLTLREAIDAA